MIVAKDLTEFELLKRARMKELQQKINVRKRFEKDYNHMVDTGVSLNLENYQEPNELESFLNKQNLDVNLQHLLVSELGATVYTAKQFIQSLDITLKERLLERFPIFKKVFEENFTKATANTLQATHSMLNTNILEREQKSSLPNLNQVKDFVKKNVANNRRAEFRNLLDAKSGKTSDTYLSAIDNLFKSDKYINALTWLNTIMENQFGVPDLPLISIDTRSDIRSSMIQEADVVGSIPKSLKKTAGVTFKKKHLKILQVGCLLIKEVKHQMKENSLNWKERTGEWPNKTFKFI